MSGLVSGDFRRRGVETGGDPMTETTTGKPAAAGWRTPMVILVCGCLIGAIGFGPRAALGLFLTPMSAANGWSREVFSLALAIQVIVWGTAQPFAGVVADRFGIVRVFLVGALLYAAGLTFMAYSSTPGVLDLSAGLLMGLGIAGTSFTLVIAAFSKLMPPEMRSLAFGAGTAAGSFGQFLFSPLAIGFIETLGWQHALVAFGIITLSIVPLATALRTAPMDAHAKTDAAQQAVAAPRHDRGLRPPLLHPAGARLLHLRLPAPVHHRAPAGLSGRPRAVGRSRRLGARRHRAVQHHRLGPVRLARRPHAQALPAVDHLHAALDRGDRLHHPAGHHGLGH